MTTRSHPPASASEARLVQALDDYLSALQEGNAPDRDTFLARYPELAGDLAACLSSLDFIRRASGKAAPGPEEGVPSEGAWTTRVLGDFRIVREIGRGGMGIVYEAEQFSLRRRVALKVLPFAAALDPQQLQRFKNEAQAVAHLHHQNIVPVYYEGCERGIHFYAMQLIEGQTLAAVIRELRQQKQDKETRRQGDKETERRGDQDQQTREQRDQAETAPGLSLSPGLLVSVSAFFRTVATLGVQAAEALEHAHQRGVVHRDIKPANLLVDVRGNLWVTDFGLARFARNAGLTVPGDRVGTLRYMSPEQALGRGQVDHRTDIYALGMTLYELLTLEPAYAGGDPQKVLGQIAFQEPRPPRRCDRTIPRELNTIVMKACAREPADRYATAQELADDLRRFLENKPIRARRPTLGEWVRKWAWRHQTLVGASVVVLVIAVLALAVSNLVIGLERREATRQRDKARWQSGRALLYFRKACDAMERVLVRAREDADQVGQEPRLEGVRRKLLEEALAFYEGLLHEPFLRDENLFDENADRALWEERGRFSRRVGDIRRLLGQHEAAADAYRQALADFQKLYEEAPKAQYLGQLAVNHFRLGHLLAETGQPREAERMLRRATALYEALAERLRHRPPGPLASLANSLNSLGVLWHTAAGQADEAPALFQRAADLQSRLASDRPTEARYRKALAYTRNNLGNAWAARGGRQAAQGEYDQALALLEPLAAEAPKNRDYLQDLARVHHNRALLWQRDGRSREAEDDYRQALALGERLLADYPDVPDYHSQLAGALHNLAGLLAGQGEAAEAGRLLQQAIDHQRIARKANPGHRGYRELLRNHYQALAANRLALGEHRQAVEAAVAMPPLFADDEREGYRAAGILIRCIPLARGDVKLSEAQRRALAQEYADQALGWLRQAGRPDHENAGGRGPLGRLLAACPDWPWHGGLRAIDGMSLAVQPAPLAGVYWTTQGPTEYRPSRPRY